MQKYQYKCVAAADSDEEDLYGVINKLKELYPEIVENNNAPSDSEFLRKKFWQGQKRVMVQYSFSERSVTVFSEDWLEKFYEDREVTEGRFKPIASMSANIKFTIILSIIFAALNFSSLLLIAGIVEFRLWIIYSALSVIYIISAFIIKSKREISELKILFIQFGGYITIAVLPIALLSNSLMASAMAWCFFIAVIPALLLSLILRFIIKALKNKN